MNKNHEANKCQLRYEYKPVKNPNKKDTQRPYDCQLQANCPRVDCNFKSVKQQESHFAAPSSGEAVRRALEWLKRGKDSVCHRQGVMIQR